MSRTFWRRTMVVLGAVALTAGLSALYGASALAGDGRGGRAHVNCYDDETNSSVQPSRTPGGSRCVGIDGEDGSFNLGFDH